MASSRRKPDGAKCHSVQVVPSSPDFLVLGLSGGGVCVSQDGGATWTPTNSGVAMDFAPPKPDGSEYEYGQDPHDVVVHPVKACAAGDQSIGSAEFRVLRTRQLPMDARVGTAR